VRLEPQCSQAEADVPYARWRDAVDRSRGWDPA